MASFSASGMPYSGGGIHKTYIFGVAFKFVHFYFSDPCNCAGFFNCTAGEREAGGCGLSGNVLSTQLAFGSLSAVAVAPDGTVHVADNGQARILGIRSVVVHFVMFF